MKGEQVLDVERGEMVEAELDRMIEKRARKEPNLDAQEELWKSSVRTYHSRQRKEIAAAWFAHFCRMAENHRTIAQDYELRAERLCEEGSSA